MTEVRQGWLCIFAKPPIAGKSKTRLGKTIGMHEAAALAGAFLRDTVRTATSTGAPVALATTDVRGDFGVSDEIPRWDQGAGDLGAKIERIVVRALASADWVIVMGADSPGLPPEVLGQAIDQLESGASAVLGPSADGGFYALGLRRCPPGTFADLPWSHENTARALTERLRSLGMPPVALPPWFDIDEATDLQRFRAEVARADAPETWALLDG